MSIPRIKIFAWRRNRIKGSVLELAHMDNTIKRNHKSNYEYKNEIYYPVSMEFRLIDNNILHLIEELEIHNFEDLSEGLQSSFKKEEKREVDFFPVILELDEEPKFSYKLSKFSFEGTKNAKRVKCEWVVSN